MLKYGGKGTETGLEAIERGSHAELDCFITKRVGIQKTQKLLMCSSLHHEVPLHCSCMLLPIFRLHLSCACPCACALASDTCCYCTILCLHAPLSEQLGGCFSQIHQFSVTIDEFNDKFKATLADKKEMQQIVDDFNDKEKIKKLHERPIVAGIRKIINVIAPLLLDKLVEFMIALYPNFTYARRKDHKLIAFSKHDCCLPPAQRAVNAGRRRASARLSTTKNTNATPSWSKSQAECGSFRQ